MKILPALALSSAAVFGVVSLSACSVARDQQSTSEYVDDATITAKIKAEFVKDDVVGATTVSVETMNGEVQLSGFAKSQAERSRAEQIAKSTQGVRSVKNSIEIRP